MHRLFWKIFVSFWAALLLFVFVTVATIAHYLDKTRTHEHAVNPMTRIHQHVGEARAIAHNQGIPALQDWLRALDRREVIPVYILDAEGRDLLERPVPEHITTRFNRRRLSDARTDHHVWQGRRRGAIVQLADGTRYRMMPDFQSVTLGRVLRRPRVIAIPIIIASIISGLVCLLLARYLTAPISSLRAATRQVAAGDLEQSVGATMGSRKDEIADLAHDFDHMTERLRILLGSQKQLLRDVSHELRSPLTRLQVALGLARQRSTGENNAELDRIERETERLNELIGQLLSLSRLESGTQTIHMEPLDLEKLLSSVVDDASYEAESKNRSVKIVNSIPVTINANESLLHSAIENVVRNAIKYTAAGSTVELTLDKDPQREGYTIEVRDKGPGVPEAMLAKLFEPFARVGDARDRASGGYGLGLAIAERAVRLHGGKMSASNLPDNGLNITIYLPQYLRLSV